MPAASISRSPSFRSPPAPPRNDTNPTTAPTRSANVYYDRRVIFGTVGCKAGSEVLGSGRSTENNKPRPGVAAYQSQVYRLQAGPGPSRTDTSWRPCASPTRVPAKAPNSRPDCLAGACCGSHRPQALPPLLYPFRPALCSAAKMESFSRRASPNLPKRPALCRRLLWPQHLEMLGWLHRLSDHRLGTTVPDPKTVSDFAPGTLLAVTCRQENSTASSWIC